MKLNSIKHASWAAALFSAAGLLSIASPAMAGGDKIFSGDGRTDWGGPVGKATLELSDDTTNLNGTFTITQGDMGGNVLVIYLQTGTNGGFSDTSGFSDNGDGIRSAISGYGGSRSTLTFLSGFTPSYAFGIQPNTFAGLWGLTNGGANSLPFISSLNLNPSSGSGVGTYTFSVPLSSLGLPTGPTVVGQTIKLLGTLISTTAYRSPESICGDTDGTSGNNPTMQTAMGSYVVGEVPATTYPVTFNVDMTAVLANGDFNPGAGDQVEVRGSFNSNAGGTFLAAGSNTNIYSVTYQDANPLGTPESFKYDIVHTSSTNYESTDPRTFVVSNSVVLPVIYFSDLAPSGNPTVPLTFSVNMGLQQFAGNFNPQQGDQVYVFGDFNLNPDFSWSTSGTPLTMSLTNTNVYVGTVSDGNYAGTPAQYKFAYYSGFNGNYVYESTANRTYNTPSSSNSYPTVYFNNATNAAYVTFSVDMAAQIIGGQFVPGEDVVTVAGDFNGWNTTIDACTNNPSSSNTNVYSITIPVVAPLGASEQFKFTTYGPNISGTDYESPGPSSPQINGNRYFVMQSVNTNLPLVNFSDESASDLLTQDTFVQFTVDMTNAVGTDAVVYNGSQSIYINGDFLGWQPWNTLLPQMTNSPAGSSTYVWGMTFPKGHSMILTYKYSMNGNDDEAGFAQNHVRYIRSVGTYIMPTDKFGTQYAEPSFGNLTIRQPSGGTIPLIWLGRPGVHLQARTSLSSGSWVDHPETDGLSATNWPFTGSSLYFRLVQPAQ